MIVAEKNIDAFQAVEELLLVPISTGDYHPPTSGFALSVENRFPTAHLWLKDTLREHPMRAGEVRTFEGNRQWLPAYALMFAGIHEPGQRGWEETPAMLEIALYAAPQQRLGRVARIAVAGNPGNGLSGLKGNANPADIRAVLEKNNREIVIYNREPAGDREALHRHNPRPSARISLDLAY